MAQLLKKGQKRTKIYIYGLKDWKEKKQYTDNKGRTNIIRKIIFLIYSNRRTFYSIGCIFLRVRNCFSG